MKNYLILLTIIICTISSNFVYGQCEKAYSTLAETELCFAGFVGTTDALCTSTITTTLSAGLFDDAGSLNLALSGGPEATGSADCYEILFPKPSAITTAHTMTWTFTDPIYNFTPAFFPANDFSVEFEISVNGEAFALSDWTCHGEMGLNGAGTRFETEYVSSGQQASWIALDPTIGVTTSVVTYYADVPSTMSGFAFYEVFLYGSVNDPSSIPASSSSITYCAPEGMASYAWTIETGDATISSGGTSACVVITPGSLDFTIKIEMEDPDDGSSNLIQWSSHNAQDVEYYIIQKSSNSNDSWEKLTEVEAERETASYIVTDDKPYSVGYYRLLALDFNGEVEYSNVVTVKNIEVNDLTFKINDGNEVILSSKINTIVNLDIWNVAGQLLFTEKIKLLANEKIVKRLDLQQLNSGVCIISLHNKEITFNKKIIIQ